MSLLNTIKELSEKHFQDTQNLRRYLHSHPELSYEEDNTAKYVMETLSSYGLKGIEKVAQTGVTALVQGQNPSKKTIALRADMDALPIQEENDVPYRSSVKGVMHACGHDAHTASLLSSARILHDMRAHFEGTIKLIFQPGEEKNPGGASLMIKDGILENPKPASIMAQHVAPLIPAGKIGFRSGMYMASCDELYLTVFGKGGHAASPHLAVDPIVIVSHIVTGLQQIVSRNANPLQPTLLTFGRISGGLANNIIPDKVYLSGTFRAMDEVWRATALSRIKEMAQGIAQGMGGRCDVDISRGYPYLENNPELTYRMRKAAELYVGEENVQDIEATLGAEDFSYYSQVLPASLYRLGTRNESCGIISYLHTPTFDIDENVLSIAPGLMAWMALCELEI